MSGKTQFFSLLMALSVQGTISAATDGPPVANLQEKLSDLKIQFEQFREEVNTKLDSLMNPMQTPAANEILPPGSKLMEDEAILARLERLERKLENVSPTTTTRTAATATGTETLPNDRSTNFNNTTSYNPNASLATLAHISRSNFAFSNALLEQLRSSNGQNLVFSPFSLSLALLMARFGAGGTTATEIETVLTLPVELQLNPSSIQTGFFSVLKSLRKPAEDYNVTVASRIYANQEIQIRQEYDSVSRQVFGTEVERLNFADRQIAAEAINSWVETQTNGKIKELISPDVLDGNTKLVLVNAIHFKSPWECKFWAHRTKKQVFHLNSTATTEVNMMFSADDYSYADLTEQNAKLVVIPYKGGRFSMHVFIPNEYDGLEGFLQALQNTTLNQIQSRIRKKDQCDTFLLRLPKFKIESTLNLVEPLKQMGARAIFSAADADFSEISEDTELYVSDVIQKAYIEVNEEGTEAAAATAMRMALACMGRTIEMTADRPFYYQIVDEEKNIILFAGVVLDPTA